MGQMQTSKQSARHTDIDYLQGTLL